ncbi:lipopolysaccharide biosynthesis protein [Rhizobium leguminosarum]|uniref:lipopolysaccharide biosynthesis protein n=1 Tax=Rhizobium leguminosarum TaxID=384 RepID=UPI0004830305|nr:oligosaccharide flippase family protein [Rhizobium leguminosarum]
MFNLHVIRSVFVFTATNALASGLPLLLLPILTRVLSPEDYGLVAMYSVFLTALGALTGLSVHGAVGMRYFDRDEIDFPKYVGSCLAILVATTSIVFVSVTLLQVPLIALTNLPGKWLLIAVLTSGMQFLLLTMLSIFQSAKQAGMFSLLRIGQAVIDALLSLVLVVSFGLAWEGRLIGISVAIAILGTISLGMLFYGRWIDLNIRVDYVRNALKFGVPLVPHVVGGMLIAMVDRLLITNYLDLASTGIYMVAIQIGLGVNLLSDACSRAVSPWLIEAIKENRHQKNVLIAKFCMIYFAALLILALMVGLLAPWILPFLVGQAFMNASSFVMLIALGQAFGGMYLVVANVIFYREKTAYLAGITISCGILNLALAYFLLRVEGLQGVAQAYATAQLLMFLSVCVFSQKLHPLPWFEALRSLFRGKLVA